MIMLSSLCLEDIIRGVKVLISAKGPQTLVSKMERSEGEMDGPLRMGETRPRPALLIRYLRRRGRALAFAIAFVFAVLPGLRWCLTSSRAEDMDSGDVTSSARSVMLGNLSR